MRKNLTIVVDCRMIDASGIGVYLRGCLSFFIQSTHNFIFLGNVERLKEYTVYSNVSLLDCNIKPFSLPELFFPVKLAAQINKADIFYSPFFSIPLRIKIPVYTTIHDIIFPDMPELISKAGLAMRMWCYRRAGKKSKKIFTVSEFSKSRILYHLGTKKQVIVTYTAILPVFFKYRENILNVQKTKNILFIGNIKKHKGLDTLLEAFYLAKNEGLPHKLLIIGSKENFRTKDKTILKNIDTASNKSVSFTGPLPDEQLIEYISTAALLVQPSLYEGFCLPPLEALALGTRVLISDIPVLKEIYSGFPVTYFEAGNTIDLKNKMMLLLAQNTPMPVLPDALLNKYTFKKTAAIILEETGQ